MDQYKNKIALVTGGSSGIGLAYAKYLIAHGWYVQIVSRNEERSNSAMHELGSANARNFLFDLTKEESIERLFEVALKPNLIIACAGVAINGKAQSYSKKDKQESYYLMCGGVIDMIQLYLPHLDKNNGRTVIISSIGAITPMPKSSIYASAKAAIHAYGRSVNKESKNVKVTVSLPGYVRTNAHKRSGLDHLEKKIPNWMWVSAEQVVIETEKASKKGLNDVVPGKVYKLTKPFLNSNLANRIWSKLSKRS